MNDELDLKVYLEVMARQWKAVLAVLAISVVLALVISFTTKPVYSAKSNVLVRSSSSSGSQLAGLAAMAGFSLGSGGGEIGELEGLLKSASVSDHVISALASGSLPGMSPGYNVTKEGAGTLKAKVTGMFLGISVEHEDPVMAACIANAYTDALSVYWNKLNYTQARKKREYLEKQLPVSERSLRKAEADLKNLMLLSGGGPSSVGGSAQSVDMQRLLRELEVQSSINKMVRTEYESAKLDEAKEVSPFSDIEEAQVPKKPTRPDKKLYLVIGVMLGIMFGAIIAFLKDGLERSHR